MKFSCLIIDDEPLARSLINNHLTHFKQFAVVQEFENTIEASQFLQCNTVDLIFLDIQMPGINGIDFLKSLTYKPHVIITSAYKEFAIDGFNLDVIDFLLKPIALDRFFKAINKFFALKANTSITKADVNQNITDLFIKDANKIYKINPLNILYVEGMREYAKVITSTENIITKSSLSSFFKKLPSKYFVRTHKSFIINMAKVKAFSSSNVEINGKRIPIGRSYKLSALERLSK